MKPALLRVFSAMALFSIRGKSGMQLYHGYKAAVQKLHDTSFLALELKIS